MKRPKRMFTQGEKDLVFDLWKQGTGFSDIGRVLDEETGNLINYSLKAYHNEYLESQTGHFYDAEHSAYFVGMPKGGFKFSRGHFNHMRFLNGPEYLKQKCVELTANYYVRNKSATVLPFPFKTLSECMLGNTNMRV